MSDLESNTEQIRRAAEAGDPDAMVELANAYESGIGCEQDISVALHWFIRAARLRNQHAFDAIGVLRAKGRGVRLNHNSARKWMQRGAASGNDNSMNGLGYLDFLQAQAGDTQRYSDARRWFLRSARRGNSEAFRNLGLLYRDGHGVEQSTPRAIKWLKRSVRRNNEKAMRSLAFLYQAHPEFSPDQSTPVDLLLKAHQRGDSIATIELGIMHFDGDTVEQDYTAAAQYLTQVDLGRDPEALYRLGWLQRNGLGTPRNPENGMRLIRLAATLGHIAANRYLSDLEPWQRDG